MERSAGVLIHVCSGKQHWKPVCHARFEVLEIDVQHGHDILSPSVYAYLLKLARLGLIKGVIGGPPCSTLSRLRNIYDKGPRPLRGRGDETRYGFQGLSEEEYQSVRDSNAIWVRMIGVWLLSHATNQDTMFGGEQPEDLPNPQNESQPSIFDWPAIVRLQELFDFRVASFDQLVLGHPTVKPTSVITNSWDLWVSLHELRATEEERQVAGSPFRGLSVQDRIRLSQKLACWAPGLSMLIAKAWIRWVRTPKQERQAAALEEALNLQALTENRFQPWGELRQLVQRRLDEAQVESCLKVGKRASDHSRTLGQLRAARLTKDEIQYRKHVLAGHLPYRRDCAICLRGGSKSRSRKSRQVTADSFSLSLDVAGPFKPGCQEDGLSWEGFEGSLWGFIGSQLLVRESSSGRYPLT